MTTFTQVIFGLWGITMLFTGSNGFSSVHQRMIPHKKNPPQENLAGRGGVGTSCHSDDADQICLALKYVVYRDYTGDPLMNKDDVANNVTHINRVWKQCKLGYEVEEFLTVNPEKYGLQFNPANTSELDDIRSNFADKKHLLVVTTGPWNRTGTLGNSGANAWTSMPGDDLMGSVLEGPVDTFPNIVAHELGHYLSLAHVGDASDLMNPIIYENSEILSDAQCEDARSTASSYWQSMMR